MMSLIRYENNRVIPTAGENTTIFQELLANHPQIREKIPNPTSSASGSSPHPGKQTVRFIPLGKYIENLDKLSRQNGASPHPGKNNHILNFIHRVRFIPYRETKKCIQNFHSRFILTSEENYIIS